MVLVRTWFYALATAGPFLVTAAPGPWQPCSRGSGYGCSKMNDYYSQPIPRSGACDLSTTPEANPTTTVPTSTPTSSPGTTPATPIAPTTPAEENLHAEIRAGGRTYFGTCADKNTLSDAPYAAIVKAEHGQVTPENSMKWGLTESVRSTFKFGDADYLVDWAITNGKLTRGHTLVWHSQLPDWVTKITDPAELTSVIESHIQNVVGRYAGKIYLWDVVNEIFNQDGTWRNSVFHKVLGESFVAIAFRAARKADPTAKLYMNDYNLDSLGPRVNATITLAKKLIDSGVPIDGIGSQAHLSLDSGATADIRGPLEALAATGLEIAVTELDVKMTLPSDPEKLADQARILGSAIRACMHVPKCVGVTVWGVSDKYSWIPAAFPGQGAALMWDENFRKKPAYNSAILGLAREA